MRAMFRIAVNLAIYLHNMPARRRARRVVREADAVFAELNSRYGKTPGR